MARSATVTLTSGSLSHTVRRIKFKRNVPVHVKDQSLIEELRKDPRFMVREDRKLVQPAPPEPPRKKRSRKPEPEPEPPEEEEDDEEESDEEEDDSPERASLEKMSKAALMKLAESHGIEIEGKPPKAEVVEAILGAFAEDDEE